MMARASKRSPSPKRRVKRAAPASIRIKRAYDEAGSDDGMRILIDRLWPRGLSKSSLKLGSWVRHLSRC